MELRPWTFQEQCQYHSCAVADWPTQNFNLQPLAPQLLCHWAKLGREERRFDLNVVFRARDFSWFLVKLQETYEFIWIHIRLPCNPCGALTCLPHQEWTEWWRSSWAGLHWHLPVASSPPRWDLSSGTESSGFWAHKQICRSDFAKLWVCLLRSHSEAPYFALWILSTQRTRSNKPPNWKALVQSGESRFAPTFQSLEGRATNLRRRILLDLLQRFAVESRAETMFSLCFMMFHDVSWCFIMFHDDFMMFDGIWNFAPEITPAIRMLPPISFAFKIRWGYNSGMSSGRSTCKPHSTKPRAWNVLRRHGSVAGDFGSHNIDQYWVTHQNTAKYIKIQQNTSKYSKIAWSIKIILNLTYDYVFMTYDCSAWRFLKIRISGPINPWSKVQKYWVLLEGLPPSADACERAVQFCDWTDLTKSTDST